MQRIRSFPTAFYTRYKRGKQEQTKGRFFDALSVKKDLGFPLEPLVLFSL